MPQLSSFTAAGGKVVAIPLDAAFLVTTTNKKLSPVLASPRTRRRSPSTPMT